MSDITLLGATGFTGRLVAAYLAANVSGSWTIAGRRRGSLAALRDELAAVGTPPDIAIADVGDQRSMQRLAEGTRVLATTVGPYLVHGEAAVAACAAAGTDYCDLTGEPEFVDRMWLRYHEQAERSGARIVHSCGFDSVPHDLGVLYTVSQLPDVPVTVRGYVRASGSISAGTYHSAIHSFARARKMADTSTQRREREPRPERRRVRALPSRPVRGPDGIGWGLPMSTIDPQVIRRSARMLDRYGPDFCYGQYALFKGLPMAAGTAVGVSALVAASQVPTLRNSLLRFKQSGDGPSPQRRARSWYQIRFVADTGERRLRTQVSGGDPGYDETSRILGESALCLAYDDLPPYAGQLTTAVAMGDRLLDRLAFAQVVDADA